MDGDEELPVDSDGDGVLDAEDAFPNDSQESVDTDGDGVGDNADVFPNDPNESADSDGDGIGDNADSEGISAMVAGANRNSSVCYYWRCWSDYVPFTLRKR